MRVVFEISLLILYITASDASFMGDVKSSITSYFKNSIRGLRDSLKPVLTADQSRFEVKHNDGGSVDQPKAIIRIFKTRDDSTLQERSGKYLEDENKTNRISRLDWSKEDPYHLDPVLNNIARKNIARKNLRRTNDEDNTDSSSSSMELRDWKNEWKETWVKKKIEAINATQDKGDVINMVAARPWGVPCGDPHQHDMPWGTCMLDMECDAEYRIYRGDFQCGRTKFVCCALVVSNYDLYQGFDVSFADSGLTTDSEERKNRGKGSKERKRRQKIRERKRRRKARERRKKKIKKNIKKIIREIRKILQKQYRNGTTQRKRKTKQLKKFIKNLKKKYKQDRKSVKDIHEIEMIKIDGVLLKKINEIRVLNKNFVDNATFRDIVVNGTMTRQGARMLVEAYPELMTYFTDNTRRNTKGGLEDYLDYDIEYGMLYY